ncbi:hypothetical protein [Parabacteroides chinchillae]|uniref:hypothetical protein n=1 Tax=Parabacteroides chinchillae TaxID=871327 RepID=UPI000CDF1AB3|nr:hypothetical protein [Parabacteroides chinchillae]
MALAWFQLPSASADRLKGDLFLLALAKFLLGNSILSVCNKLLIQASGKVFAEVLKRNPIRFVF